MFVFLGLGSAQIAEPSWAKFAAVPSGLKQTGYGTLAGCGGVAADFIPDFCAVGFF